MITLRDLARLAAEHADDLDHPVAPLTIAGRTFDTDREPVLMGVVNLSRDSTYRGSIATTPESAVRKGVVQAAQGAHVVDVGAESSQAWAKEVAADQARAQLVPLIEQLTAAGVVVSVEGYDASVVRAGLEAGARVVNYTGSRDDDAVFAAAAEHDAMVVLCHVLGEHARALDGSDVEADPVPAMLDAFARRIDRARAAGVTDLVVDPGLGFGYRLGDLRARARYQAVALLHSFRLRRLGVPVCHALPHSFDLFEDQFRHGEGFFAVLAHLGGTGFYRTHEVPAVRAVLDSLGYFSAFPDV